MRSAKNAWRFYHRAPLHQYDVLVTRGHCMMATLVTVDLRTLITKIHIYGRFGRSSLAVKIHSLRHSITPYNSELHNLYPHPNSVNPTSDMDDTARSAFRATCDCHLPCCTAR